MTDNLHTRQRTGGPGRLDAARGAAPVALAGVMAALIALGGCSSSDPAGPSVSETFLVDLSGAGDFVTIQEGLNAADNGDTVLVAPGTYSGNGNRNLEFYANVVLKGTGTRDEVVIDCEGVGRGFRIVGRSPVIENLRVANGDTVEGGGMYLEGASPTLMNVAFVDNAADYGGAVYCDESSPTVVDALFDGNSAAVQGGGMLSLNSSPSLSGTVFSGNTSSEYGGSGGGVVCIFSSPAFAQCVFYRNSSDYGGAIYCGASSPSITSCTIVENQGSHASALCFFFDSSPSIDETIVACNRPGEAYYCDDSDPFTTLSCVFDNGSENDLCGPHSTSMLYEDPLFCDLESGDLTLRADSPCLPENNQWEVQMGAFGQGCGAPGRR